MHYEIAESALRAAYEPPPVLFYEKELEEEKKTQNKKFRSNLPLLLLLFDARRCRVREFHLNRWM